MRLLLACDPAHGSGGLTVYAARAHLQVYRPSIVNCRIWGLPDGNGIDLIAELGAARSRRVDACWPFSGDSHLASGCAGRWGGPVS